ncbi:hypothetical protein [Duganella vulcania]|uniref:Uncharacterized protein n=1 Tax=Duganella vulcania TaxID=2692166 RepID=A0A845GD96_9BURK|nr:hypothetical protein [Duganella vulcania]MYM92593.1 hypothetical protein [Duganella vulcania]
MSRYRAELAIADRHLTATELGEKYLTEHPVWQLAQYRARVENIGKTRDLDYWAWVEQQLQLED